MELTIRLMINFRICALHLCHLLENSINVLTTANTTVHTALGQCNSLPIFNLRYILIIIPANGTFIMVRYDTRFVKITNLCIVLYMFPLPLCLLCAFMYQHSFCSQLQCYRTKVHMLLPHLLKVTCGTWSDGWIESSSKTWLIISIRYQRGVISDLRP